MIGGYPSVERDGFSDQLDRRFILTFLMRDQPEKVSCVGFFGIDCKHAPIKRLRFGDAARLKKFDSLLENMGLR